METYHSRSLSHRRFIHLVWTIVLLFGMSGCGFFTINTMKNHPLDPASPPVKTRALQTVTYDDLSDGVFIGIALSGGGSRAANFSAAVLLELDKLGILSKATAISSVSGSSLPAAYYGLYGNTVSRWNEQEVRKQMQKNFESRWIWRWFLPQNIFLYWTSNFNRSDMMKEVLDSNLFHGKTFAAMTNGQPRILINSTTLSEGTRFVFSEEQFHQLNSRIDTYPVANAVMASSAFPGVFHDMTLHDYYNTHRQSYAHILDGGPSDNLGTTTLLDMVRQLYQPPNKQPKGCFLFVVDAYPYPKHPQYIHTADTRHFVDFFVDTNVAAASDAMLTARRIDLLNQLNIDASEMDIEPLNISDDTIDLGDDLQIVCGVWHLSLQRLFSSDFAKNAAQGDPDLIQHIVNDADVVNAIPTRYQLTGKDPDSDVELSSRTLQDYLFKAASYLIYQDQGQVQPPLETRSVLVKVCNWFAKKGVHDLNCPTKMSTSSN